MGKESDLISLTLSIYERVVLVSFLPTQASIHQGKMIRELVDQLGLTDEEVKESKANFRDDGSVSLKNISYSKSNKREFKVPGHKIKILRDSLKLADQRGLIPVDRDFHEFCEKLLEIAIIEPEV